MVMWCESNDALISGKKEFKQTSKQTLFDLGLSNLEDSWKQSDNEVERRGGRINSGLMK